MQLTKFDKDRLIAAGDKVMAAEALIFDSELIELLNLLVESVNSRNIEATMKQAYHLKASAGGFGWPMVGQAAGFVHLAMEKGRTSQDMFQLSTIFLQKIQLLVNDNNRGETAEGVEMLKAMYKQLETQGMLD